jgi:Ser/Thr protein kinase RdoA (MazF antagonist)
LIERKELILTFPVRQSVLADEALSPIIAREYRQFGEIQACRFFYQGLNDIYQVRANGQKFMLRVYRAGWRSNADVAYEVDLLNYVCARGVEVARPVPRQNGEFFFELPAPEGPRQAVLFTFAPGGEMRYNEEQARLFGRTLAGLHNALAGFNSPHDRFKLDLDHLLREPLRLIEPLYRERPAHEWDYLSGLAGKFEARLQEFERRGLERGVCHGDPHLGNVHYEPETGLTTLLDFDCAGADGYRAYELAVFYWASRERLEKAKSKPVWEAYLDGYTGVRPLSPVDIEAVPLFVALRQFWMMGIYARLGANFHYEALPEHYFSGFLNYLKKWEVGYFDL